MSSEEELCDEDDTSVPMVADVSSRTLSCSACGRDETVMEATFTVTTRTGVHHVGCFAYCFACEAVPSTEVTAGE